MFTRLRSLFSKKKYIDSFSSLMVDMHAHLIPDIDDGVRSVEESIEIIEHLKMLGYSKSITTPHIMPGGYNNTPEIIQNGLGIVQNELKKRQIDFSIEAAAEYYLDEQFEEKIKDKSLLTFGDQYVLFELSYMYKPLNLEQTIFDLNAAGYKPILAHPERYPFLVSGKNPLEEHIRLKELGVYYQLNLFSLVGVYGKGAMNVAQHLVQEEMIDFVGTDIHHSIQLTHFESCMKNKYVHELLFSSNIRNKTLM